jgi:hypothetical protein
MTHISREALPQTDAEIEAAFDALGYGLCVSDLSYFPSDEMDAIRAARRDWSDPGRIETDDPNHLVITRAQATRGQTRRDVVVVRFGAYCAVYGADK